MRGLILTAVVMVGGCAQQHEEAALCSPDDGTDVVMDHEGTIIPAISSCAVFRRAVDAFELRAEELDCAEAFPLVNPLGDYERCFAWQADEHADFLRASESCELLVARAALIDNWSGFECGGPGCYAPPYSDFRSCGGVPCGRTPECDLPTFQHKHTGKSGFYHKLPVEK